ncbi:MAG TPA: pantetheine-phosphate adenylyltransferase [Candidatus Onthenecus intestinigallinarum]|uniref:Phosphopantetheine adenylyltransferase n=1 Tax=Candidatus Onthenecus intestinigallinarum TaxID=2840875 RepID=A0A9D1CPU3_9FIRM|nr:pantetheine-phosphate adenylyltransferase [Candidatus Onthenecus intestinigallinarum]
MNIALYPGSFDPITVGHLDIIERAARLYDDVVVAVLHNPKKQGAFPVQTRLALIERACAHLPNVRAEFFEGLLVDYARQVGASVVLRGLRAVSDFEYEFQMAQMNRRLCPGVETLFMMTRPEHAYISSSGVREIATFGGDVSAFVPPCILNDVQAALDAGRRNAHGR